MTDHEAAILSEITYREPESAEEAASCVGWKSVPIFEGETEAYAFTRDGETVIGFRGTSSFSDAITDLKAKKVSGPMNHEKHRGFVEYVDRVWKKLVPIVEYSDSVKFVGHSLGGAAAQIAAYRFAISGLKAKSIVTFGGPRAGGRGFVDAYDSMLGDRTRRYRRVLDPVPHLPPRRWGYRHTVGERYIDRNGKIHERIGWWAAAWDKLVAGTVGRRLDGKPEPLAAHSVDDYVKALS